ncbi:MAG: ATP-dependent RNA helicase [Candidatus Fluviicola riflensis]|nr:MAG: ATP-dependent RNA helicase [Candidatus Fluviicola riflensis]OGS79050.1 MAG: ATP-dependent RNA helicase [Candidatus Fluviicola riflensis]OGS86073.1 MAG: ATP-dependent RNA helicase [Fluviicola sp. RIFCSPHIGHO2_12_FULL_43_24]OGS86482.1 MAG: ATP-dependent RNA helicase [Fluviicola sp. RIFCSPHIGHO2_01_FULL_43_53]
MKFNELDLNDSVLEAIYHMGFENATPIQEQAIPHILKNTDLLACAQTGTGKTAAFILPILHKLTGKEDTSINTLILVPTRELAVQIEQEIQGLSYFVSVGSIAIYGGGDGQKWEDQKSSLVGGTDIVVATPGKLLSHMMQGYVDFSQLEHLVLDEADKMLDMGFAEDIERIISYVPKKRQTLLFSATMPNKIKNLANKILQHPIEIALSISKPAAGVSQNIYLTVDANKNNLLKHILDQRPDYTSIIIFTSQKSKIHEIVYFLRKAGYKATEGVSSNLEQEQREEVLRGFRSKRTRILVATDVMSRGIDIKEINMVINYDAPRDAEDYVHRIGRTARANTKGEAYTLINEKDLPKLARIERLIEAQVPRLPYPESMGTAPDWTLSSKPSGGGGGNHSGNRNKKKPFFKRNKPSQA